MNKNLKDGRIGLKFFDKRTFTNEEKGTCVAQSCSVLKVNFNNIFFSPYVEIINADGKAKCGPNDTYNEKSGVLIASARAENEAYFAAKNRLNELRKQLESALASTDEKIRDIEGYIAHNKEFIDKVSDGNFKPRKK